MNMLKSLILALFLTTTSAAAEITTLSVDGLCTKFGVFGGIFALNYTIGGYTKEDQIKHLNEVVFEQEPVYKFFEPGLLKSLDAIERGKNKLDEAKTEEEKAVIAGRFASVVQEACLLDSAKGWIQSTPEIRILE